MEAGSYVYVGSCGRSCAKRISRHFSEKKKRFWHIDFLTDACSPTSVVVLRLPEPSLALSLSRILPGVPGFGSSDDRKAGTHLFRATLASVIDALTEL
ncbi:MAG: DUF123 domain-containing protein [Fervidicoccaceae archaeon]